MSGSQSTYLLSEDYSLGNYEKFVESATYLRVLWRTLLASASSRSDHAVLALPYAYILVRSRPAR